ncbi:hypothetical protein R6Q57_005668, partial [Mikania cordata]
NSCYEDGIVLMFLQIVTCFVGLSPGQLGLGTSCQRRPYTRGILSILDNPNTYQP